MTKPRSAAPKAVSALPVAVGLAIALAGCAQEKADPLEVTNNATITDITANTQTGFYTVDSAVLNTTSLGTELTLGFTISILTLLIVLAACGVGLFVLPPGVPTKILAAVIIVVMFAVLIVSGRAGRSGR